MQQFFQKSKMRLNDLLNEISNYTQTVYKQSANVYTPASPWGQLINVFARIAQNLLFYNEDSITELNINTATRITNLQGLITLTGHNPTRAIAAMGDLFLVPSGKTPDIIGQNIIIPNFTKVKCRNNNLMYTSILGQDEIKINIFQDKKKFYLRVLQGEIESQQFTGTGLQLQSFECNMTEGKFIDNFFVNVFINSEKWQKYDTLYDFPKNGNYYIVKTGITSGIDVFFGTNNLGRVPDLGATIVVEYLVTAGLLGNITDTSNLSFEFVDTGFDENGNEVDLN
jgi:hypothetical protein